MKKIHSFLVAAALLCGMNLHAQTLPEGAIQVNCPDETEAQTPDYYLSHIYYALCTNLTPKVDDSGNLVQDNGAYVLVNTDGNLIKLCGDGKHIDWHWDDWYGKSSIIYDNIFVSETGDYDLHWYQQNGGKVNVYVNGDSIDAFQANRTDTLTIYRLPLKAGEANKIKIEKLNDWPQSLGIMLSKSAAVVTTTVITFDMQGGVGGTETVEVQKGNAMPEITLPTRDGYTFEGYFTAAEGGDQYYAMDGSSFKAWDKDDEAYTLYAHWNDGGTGGDCPSVEQAISENWYLTHMYDARCTELTNTWEKDNGEYIYTNVDGDKIKITTSGEWMDFYFADPSSIVFDSIYVSEDGYYDMTYFFRCDVIDGEVTAGAKSQVWVNDELSGELTVWVSDEGLELDQTKYEGIELYADYPNKIKIQKINGWPLTRGIQLSRQGMGVNNVHTTSFFVSVMDGMLSIQRLAGNSEIAIYTLTGKQILSTTTNAASYTTALAPGAYIVEVNGEFAKAVVR